MSVDTQHKDPVLSWNTGSEEKQTDSKLTLQQQPSARQSKRRKSHWKPRVIVDKFISEEQNQYVRDLVAKHSGANPLN